MPIPAPAFAAAGDLDSLAGHVEVGQKVVVVGVEHQGAGRDGDDQIRPAVPGHLLAHAGFAATGLPVVPAGEVEERVFARIGQQDDAAAVGAVTAVGAALGDVLFPPKRNTPVPAVAGFHVDDGFVDEHGGRIAET